MSCNLYTLLIVFIYLYLKNCDGVIQHLHPDCEHFTTLFRSSWRCSRAPVYASWSRMRMVHCGISGNDAAASVRKTPRGSKMIHVHIHNDDVCDGGFTKDSTLVQLQGSEKIMDNINSTVQPTNKEIVAIKKGTRGNFKVCIFLIVYLNF